MRARILAGLVTVATLVTPTTSDARSVAEWRARTFVDKARDDHVQHRLRRNERLDAIAERHARRMRAAADLFHNDDLAREIPGRWNVAGENVGIGSSVAALHAAFMDSPPHRHALLDPRWDEFGVGIVVNKAGEVFETQVFVDRDL